ncbi:hypothetical protein QYE76_037871 [Lolium multiflorum]|uniref:Transposase (putative) gypsy type domain-containing protein n=1 Tax=Lolium multiflorum TaxID=4521 RepID=A0AAD8T7T1_LOLMU|nr:hypothetical protein QYE76_037871 [Lolium multiflorum]
MVRKRSLTLATSAMTSGAATKAPPSSSRRGASDASPPVPAPPAPESSTARPAPGDWPVSTTTKRDEKKARSLGIISSDEGNVILPGAASRPNPPAGFTVMFLSFLYRGLSLPAHEFLHRLLRVYEIQLWQLTPNSILHLAIFITLCEAFLGIKPHFGLWKKIFFVKRYNCSGGSFVIGGVGFVVRKEVNYFNFPMRESVQGWRLKWFYIRDSSATDIQLPPFTDVLEAVPKKSWKNILSPDERPTVDRLFERFLRIKESEGQTMIGTEVAAVFLKRRVQPIMSRAHPMWLYSGPKDETRVNVAELSEKELLDEVRRLTLFSQEDSIPLISLQPPFDADHPPTEIPIAPERLQNLSNDASEERDSSIPVESHAKGNINLEDEHDDPMNPEASSIDPQSLADDISDTAGSIHDDDADRTAFVDAAAEKADVLPSKRSSGGFADEDDLFDIDEGFIEPPSKKVKPSTSKPIPAASEASAPAAAPAAQVSTASSLSKGKEIPSPAAATAPPEKPDFRAVISSLEAFASQYSSLETDKARLQKEIESTSLKLEGAIKIAAEARRNADSLKDELERLKRKLKDEETSHLAAEAQMNEKDDLLRQSVLALLKAADIPAETLDKLPNNSPANALSLTLESHKLVQALLQKNKGVMARMHSMVFPKVDQNKTLEQLTDAFAVDTKEVIEVFKRTSRTYGALLAFQLMMGHGFKADIEQMSKELPEEQDGRLVDLGDFKVPALRCALQLLELVSSKKSSTGPSLSNQTQAP